MHGGGVFLLSLTSCDASIRAHTVTFNPQNGSESWTVTVTDGSLVAEPDTPRRDGYSFLGWYIDGANTKYNFTTPVISDVILEAQWSMNTTYYTVIFNGNKPQNAAEDVQNLPTTVSIPSGGIIGDRAHPTLEGYTFRGW